MSDAATDRYEVVIGLEVHTHLLTDSKLLLNFVLNMFTK